MRSDDEAICLQAIEFWSTVCDEEMDRAEIIAEVRDTLHESAVI